MRTACIIIFLAAALSGCGHKPPDYVSKYTPPPPQPLVASVAVIGDGYTGGSRMGGYRSHGWPALAAAELRKQGVNIELKVGAEDGSGYVTAGREHGLVFDNQVPEVVNQRTRLVVIFGSTSDMGAPIEELLPAVEHTLGDARAAPNASLLVIGPAWADNNPPPALLAVRDTVRAGAQSVGATFVDPIAEHWLASGPDLVGADHISPTDAGHVHMAEKIAPLIAQQLREPALPVSAPPQASTVAPR